MLPPSALMTHRSRLFHPVMAFLTDTRLSSNQDSFIFSRSSATEENGVCLIFHTYSNNKWCLTGEKQAHALLTKVHYLELPVSMAPILNRLAAFVSRPALPFSRHVTLCDVMG